MTELAEDRPKAPKLPNIPTLIAVLLELSIVFMFTVHHSVVGLLLCLAYFWFSATRALLFDRFVE